MAAQGRLPIVVTALLLFDHRIAEFVEQKRAFYELVARLSGPLKARLGGLR
jgi:hypothetical protein